MTTSKKRRFLTIAGLILAALLAAAFGGGLFMYRQKQPELEEARRQAAELTQSLADQKVAHAQKMQALEDADQPRQQTLALLQARRAVSQSMDQLEARNYGLSQKSSLRASRLLTESGLADPRVEQSAAALVKLTFDVDGNSDATRETLRNVRDALDGILNERPTE